MRHFGVNSPIRRTNPPSSSLKVSVYPFSRIKPMMRSAQSHRDAFGLFPGEIAADHCGIADNSAHDGCGDDFAIEENCNGLAHMVLRGKTHFASSFRSEIDANVEYQRTVARYHFSTSDVIIADHRFGMQINHVAVDLCLR